MSNEINEQKILSENVKTSFDNIVTVYEESSLLLKDLDAKLEKIGFGKIKGNEISTSTSKHIGKPRDWLFRYATLFFKAKDEPNSKRLLSATVMYFDLELFKPCLIMGVVENFDDTKNYNWWMDYVFFNRNVDMFRYYGKGNKSIKSPHLDWQKEGDEWGFKRLHDGATSYPKAGKLFAVPLLEIKPEDVVNLAERVSKLWDTNLVWDEANQ